MTQRKKDIIAEFCMMAGLIITLCYLPAAQLILMTWHRVEDSHHHYVGTKSEGYLMAGFLIFLGTVCFGLVIDVTRTKLKEWKKFEEALDNGGHWSEEDRRNEAELNAFETQSPE